MSRINIGSLLASGEDVSIGKISIPLIVPQKGVDYWTNADKQEVISEAVNSVNTIIEPQERVRQSNELTRITNEQNRISAEEIREANETVREERFVEIETLVEKVEDDIADINTEQTEQNTNIQNNTDDIVEINQTIGAINTDIGEINQDIQDLETNKADKIEIPTKTSDLTNDSGFIDKSVDDLINYTTTTNMNSVINTAVGTETTARQNADINIQSQIDAITSASDVVDVVSTYQDLLDYDTTKLTDKDVIKVMQDSTHSNALSYYRWLSNAWTYVGSEGPFYTKGETDTLVNEKYTKPASGIPSTDLADDVLTDYVKNIDYATTNKGGVIKVTQGNGIEMGGSGNLIGHGFTYDDYSGIPAYALIAKSTLENVITGKELVNKTYVDDIVGDIESILETLDIRRWHK